MSNEVYRIIDVGNLFKMFKMRRNYLSSPENWDDYWEKLEIKFEDKKNIKKFKELRSLIFAQCWSRESYSWAMWKLNSPFGLGVRIKTTTKKLYDSLPNTLIKGKSVFLKNVEYCKEAVIKTKIKSLFFPKDCITISTMNKMFF